MANTLPWKDGAIELRDDKDGLLYLEKATPASDRRFVYEPEEVDRLWRQMVASKRHISGKALTLYGSTLTDKGFPKALASKHMAESKNGKSYVFAWDAAVVGKFKPVQFALRLNFFKPCLWAFSSAFKMGGSFGGKAATPRRTLDIPLIGEEAAGKVGKPKPPKSRVAELNAALERAGVKHTITEADLPQGDDDDQGEE